MGLFGGSSSEKGADAPPSTTPESIQKNKYPTELLDTFDVNVKFMEEVEEEFHKKEGELKKAKQKGISAFKLLRNGTIQSEMILGSGKFPLIKEVEHPEDYPEVVTGTWNDTTAIPKDEHHLDQLKVHLASYAYEAVHNGDFETAAKALTIISGDKPAWENSELMHPIRQVLVNEKPDELRYIKYQLIIALNEANKNPDKLSLKPIGELESSPAEVKTEIPYATQVVDSTEPTPDSVSKVPPKTQFPSTTETVRPAPEQPPIETTTPSRESVTADN